MFEFLMRLLLEDIKGYRPRGFSKKLDIDVCYGKLFIIIVGA